MAISMTLARLLGGLRAILPAGGSLLEVGEANWYDPKTKSQIPGCPETDNLFDVAKAFYADLFAPSRIVSVDMNGTEAALRLDLNEPLQHLGEFDVVMNHGTLEHVFNVAQVFASMHCCCKVGGIMVHESPFTGWLDHGFYCIQPTLFYDLALANGYEVVEVAIEEVKSDFIKRIYSREHMTESLSCVPNNAMLFAVLRKMVDEPFVIPTQGYYARTISDQAMQSWSELR